MTQVNAHMATVDHDRQRQAAHRQYKLHKVFEFASVLKGHATLISTRDSAHKFSLKLSSSVCVALVASLTGNMAGIL